MERRICRTSSLNMPLSVEQLRGISLFTEGFTNAEIARKLGVTVRSVQRWHKNPEFASAVAKIRQKATEKVVETTATHISNQVQGLLPKAIRLLERFLDDDEARAADRLRAVHLIGTWAGLTQQKVPSSASKGEETQSQAGLSEELLEQIRNQVLGVK